MLSTVKDKQLVECFPSSKPKTIRYCSTLITNKDAEVLEIKLEDFCEQQEFIFSSSLNCHVDDLIKIYNSSYEIKERFQYNSRIKNCLDAVYTNTQFIICKMPEGIGHGLFLSNEAVFIPKGTIVMSYGGALKTPVEDKRYCTDYAMSYGLLDTVQIQSSLNKSKSYCYVDAKKIGNLSRFIQHAPAEDELQAMRDPNNIKSKIMTANLIGGVTWYLGFPIHYLQAIRDILPGEQLCLSYGKKYWDTFSNSPCLFNTAGEIIAKVGEGYGTTIIEKKDSLNVDILLDAPRANISPYQFQKDFPISSLNNGSINLKEYIIEAIQLSLENYIKYVPHEDKEEIASHLNLYNEAITSANNKSIYNLTYDFFNDRKLLKPLRKYLLNLSSLLSDSLNDTNSENFQYRTNYSF